MLANAANVLTCPTGTTYNNTTGQCVDGSACPQDSTFQNGQYVKSIPAMCPSGYYRTRFTRPVYKYN